MTMETAPSRFVEAITSDGFWRRAVESNDSVVGHIFRVDRGEYAYFAGRFNALTVTFQGPEPRTPQEADRRQQAVTP